jgi:hypothetical protein
MRRRNKARKLKKSNLSGGLIIDRQLHVEAVVSNH